MAASSEFWIPLTERGKSSGIHFHSAVKVGGEKSALNEIIREIENDDTVVIYMGLEHLKDMADELHRRLSKETNINVISKVSYKDSDVISGNTKVFSKIKNHELPASPAVIVLGNHTQIPGRPEQGEKGKVTISTRIKNFTRQTFLNLF
jgi:uroporphyrin-III C-methyltransferase